MSDVPPGPPQFPSTPPLAPPAPPAPPGTVRPGGAWPVPPEPEAPSRKPMPWVVVVAVLVVAALVGGVAAVAVNGGDDHPPADIALEPNETTTTEAAEDPTTTTPTTDAPAEDVEAVIADIEDFVEQERGLPFLRDVVVDLEDDAAFEARLLADFEEDTADLVTAGHVLEALGLVEPGTDLVAALRSLLGAGVVGFYDPETDELVVRGTEATPYVRTVIAHELTHALDDQHFELERPAVDDADDEQSFGFTGLVEGNASRVEQAYRSEVLTPDEQDAADAEELVIGSEYDYDSIPLVLFESVGAPYILGPELVDAILADGGQERLDAAFADPPTTSEGVLEPGTYLDGQGALPVPAPTADGPEIDRNVLGELGLAQILGESSFVLTGFGEIPESVAGWGGDQYVAWTDGDRTCVRANIVGDTPADTAEIGEALQEGGGFVLFPVQVTVEVSPDLVTFTSCG